MGYKQLIITCSTALFLLATSTVSAQETKSYNGFFQLGEYRGEASFNYRVINKDTLYDGDFKFQRTNPKDLLERKDISFSINGQFENQYPVGYWNFRFNKFKTSKQSSFQDNKYVLNVDGEQQIAFGNFKNGNPNGEWIIKNQRIKNSEVDDISFNSIIKFDQGVPQQSFTIEDKKQELVGRFLRNGLAHDKWILFSDDTLEEVESWNFDDGILKNIEIQRRSGSKQFNFEPISPGKKEVVNLGDRYFKILKLQLSAEDEKTITKSGIAQLLHKNYRHYKRIDSILSQLSGVKFNPAFKVIVPNYALSKQEEILRDSIVFYYQKSRKISDFLRNDTQLNIRKLSDKEVQSLGNTLEHITDRILLPLGKLSDYAEEGLLKHIQRDKLIPKFWKEEAKEFKEYNNYGIVCNKDNDQPLEKVQCLSKQTFLRLDEIRVILEDKIYNQVKQQEAITLEEKIILQLDQLTEQITLAKQDTLPYIYVNAIERLKIDAEDLLSKYAAIRDVDKKIAQGKVLVTCFRDYVKVGKTLSVMPKQEKQIQQKYTDAVWNPFTATIMDETVKKRIISAYQNVLLPFFLLKIKDGLECEEAPHWVEVVNTTYERILKMRDEDTRKMERKLKKEEDPLVILQRFQIQHALNLK